MLQQFITRCSDVINLKGNHGRRSKLSPLSSWSENLENLLLGNLENRYSTFINYDCGQADDLGEERQRLVETVGSHAEPRVAFDFHEAIRSQVLGANLSA